MTFGKKVSLYSLAPTTGSVNSKLMLYVNGVNPTTSAKLTLFAAVTGPFCPLSWDTYAEDWGTGENVYDCVDGVFNVGRRLSLYAGGLPFASTGGRLGLFLCGPTAGYLPLFMAGSSPGSATLPLYCYGSTPTSAKLTLFTATSGSSAGKLNLYASGW